MFQKSFQHGFPFFSFGGPLARSGFLNRFGRALQSIFPHKSHTFFFQQ